MCVLSVIMTAVSSTLVLIFMPLNVSVYTLPWVTDGHVIPFSALAIASAETWLAVGAGVACHYHFPEFAHKAVTVSHSPVLKVQYQAVTVSHTPVLLVQYQAVSISVSGSAMCARMEPCCSLSSTSLTPSSLTSATRTSSPSVPPSSSQSLLYLSLASLCPCLCQRPSTAGSTYTRWRQLAFKQVSNSSALTMNRWVATVDR